ncbi:Dihydrodipicolinate synthase [Rhodovastum atsumiense]|uniref:Dihydrodipicolinate synthase family protein n=1 Tax=Rhodovastum atsumiense TaxID=504468 RepID=A0A5M6IV27_9PROT|nr:dihydrodipicolinate synthase family protein [Rhodovastum atsumiense]KAA5612163.1 dihydrodipicolinate synthase family protein [Rhodovastum atsumiense]CAH2603888.1 Dihydrodipicolinate synthase [Rhodovastum atsumiense]
MALIHRNTSGVYIIAATPFTETGAVDVAGIDSLVDFYAARGVTGMTVLGIMGEADKLTAEERRAVLDRFLARAGAMPVIVGISDSGMANLADFGKYAMDRGAAGVMVAPNRGVPREDRVIGYFAEVCRALGPDVPVVYQDYPQTTGVPVSVRTILEIADANPQIVMLKHEDSPGLAKITAIRAAEAKGGRERLSILVGNGGLHLPQELQRGVDGAMTGFAYPEALVDVVRLHQSGAVDRAEDVFDAYLPILRHEQQPGIGLALRKMILHRRGAIPCPAVRAPGPLLSPTDLAELERLMARTAARVASL